MIGLEYICKIRLVEYKELASIIGVIPPVIQDWLKGRRNIPQARLEQISSFFNIEKDIIAKEISQEDKIKILQLEIIRLQNPMQY